MSKSWQTSSHILLLSEKNPRNEVKFNNFFTLLSSYYVHDIDAEDAFEKIEGIRWEMALGLSLTWVFVYLANFYGVKAAAKVIIFVQK